MVVKVLKLVVLFLIVVYSNTAPVNTSLRGTTTTATDLPAYCSRNISICRVDINKLYTESDKIYDLLVDELCPMTVSKLLYVHLCMLCSINVCH